MATVATNETLRIAYIKGYTTANKQSESIKEMRMRVTGLELRLARLEQELTEGASGEVRRRPQRAFMSRGRHECNGMHVDDAGLKECAVGSVS